MSWRLIAVVWWDEEGDMAHLTDVLAMHAEDDDDAAEQIKEISEQYPKNFHFLEKKDLDKDSIASVQADMPFIEKSIRELQTSLRFPT